MTRTTRSRSLAINLAIFAVLAISVVITLLVTVATFLLASRLMARRRSAS